MINVHRGRRRETLALVGYGYVMSECVREREQKGKLKVLIVLSEVNKEGVG